MDDSTKPQNDSDESASQRALVATVERALAVQQPAIEAYVKKLRNWTSASDASRFRRDRDGSPAAAIRAAERQYTTAVAGMGVAVGATAAAPGVGTAVAAAATLGEMATNAEATMLFVLACAQIHGIEVNDLERRRMLFTAILLGNSGAKAVERVAGRTGPHWAKHAVNGVSRESLRAINKVLGPNFITKYGTKQGVVVLGRVAPFGAGAVIGGAGNTLLARMTVRAARKAFGPAPEAWNRLLE